MVSKKIANASLIAGLKLFGLNNDYYDGYIEKFNIDIKKFRQHRNGLDWSYPKKIIYDYISEWFKQEVEDTGEFPNVMCPDWGYVFKLNGDGIESGEFYNYKDLLNLSDNGIIYVYWDSSIIAYKLDINNEKQFLEIKKKLEYQ